MAKDEFLVCKEKEGRDTMASLADDNIADGNSNKLFDEI